MIPFPNIDTAREVFEERAEELDVGQRYVRLALNNYKNKLNNNLYMMYF